MFKCTNCGNTKDFYLDTKLVAEARVELDGHGNFVSTIDVEIANACEQLDPQNTAMCSACDTEVTNV